MYFMVRGIIIFDISAFCITLNYLLIAFANKVLWIANNLSSLFPTVAFLFSFPLHKKFLETALSLDPFKLHPQILWKSTNNGVVNIKNATWVRLSLNKEAIRTNQLWSWFVGFPSRKSVRFGTVREPWARLANVVSFSWWPRWYLHRCESVQNYR